METIIHLDTDVVVWIKTAQHRLPPSVRARINAHDCLISPAVELELQFLYEIGRLKRRARELISDLHARLGLKLDVTPFDRVIEHALDLDWTRDPFDRLICAQALAADAPLLTRDGTLRARLPLATWD